MVKTTDIQSDSTRRSLLQSVGVLGVGWASSSAVSGKKPKGKGSNQESNSESYTGFRLPGMGRFVSVSPDALSEMAESDSRFGSQSNTISSGESTQVTVKGSSVKNNHPTRLDPEEERYLKKCGIEPNAININQWYKLKEENSQIEISGISNGNSSAVTIAHSDDAIRLEVSSPRQDDVSDVELPTDIDPSGWFRVTVIEQKGKILAQLYQKEHLIGSSLVHDVGGGNQGITGRLNIRVRSGEIKSSPISAGTLHDVLSSSIRQKGEISDRSVQDGASRKSITFELGNSDSYSLTVTKSGDDRYVADQDGNTFYSYISPDMIENVTGNADIVFDDKEGDQ